MKTPKSTYLLLVVAMLSSWNAAASPFVKVESGACLPNGSAILGGSGTLIQPCGSLDSCVITAAHVVYHASNQAGFCHKLVTEEGDEFTAELIAVDVMSDLAILSLPADADLEADPVELSSAESLAPEQVLTSIGYPRSADYLVRYPAKVLMTESPRSFSLGVGVAELLGLTEYGMSGGAVLDAEGRLAGVLSHHALFIGTGGEARSVTREPVSLQGQLIAMMVRADFVSEWLKTATSDPQKFPKSSTSAQAVGRGSVILPRLELQESESCIQNRRAPIGGGDLSGIGGGDLTGIGGRKVANSCVIRLLPKGGSATRSDAQDPMSRIAETLLKNSAGMVDPTIYGLRKGSRLISPSSVLEVMKKLQQGYVAEIAPYAMLHLALANQLPPNFGNLLAARGRTDNLGYSVVWCPWFHSLSNCREKLAESLRSEISATGFPILEEDRAHYQFKLRYPAEFGAWFEARIPTAFSQSFNSFEAIFTAAQYEERRLDLAYPYALVGGVQFCSTDYIDQYVTPRMQELFGNQLANIHSGSFVRGEWHVVEKILKRFRSCYEYARLVPQTGAYIPKMSPQDYVVGSETYDPNSQVRIKCESWDPIAAPDQEKVRKHLEALGVHQVRFNGKETFGITDRLLYGGLYSQLRVESWYLPDDKKYFHGCESHLTEWQSFQTSYQDHRYEDREKPSFPGGI
jgi:hypothetical protein